MEQLVVNEKVSVLAGSYENGQRKVFQVRWKGTEYSVRTQTAHWTSSKGVEMVDHFTVKTGGGDVLWLQHYRLKHEWWIERITLV